MKSAFLLLLLAGAGLSAFPQMRTGQAAPELTLPDRDGHKVQLSGLKGTVVLIDFWASWCGPCRANNPHLAKLYRKYHQKGLEIVGVSLDENGEAWKEAVGHDKLEWVQLNDDGGQKAISAITYGVYSIPASFLVDKEGIIQGIDLEGWDLESKIKTLLKK
jgi:peroxiredoxin